MATLTGFEKDNEGAYIEKDPTAELTYTVDWSSWLPSGQTITTSSWTLETISGDASPLVNEAQVNTTTTATISISGGTTGKIYKVYNSITTGSGLIERRYFRISVKLRSL